MGLLYEIAKKIRDGKYPGEVRAISQTVEEEDSDDRSTGDQNIAGGGGVHSLGQEF